MLANQTCIHLRQ